MKVSIAKALKLKNRLGARIKKAQNRVEHWNSNAEGTVVPVDVRAEYEELTKLNGLIREVGVAIYRSNASICHLIKEMSETKAHLSFLSGISTKEGVVQPSGRYGESSDPVNYVAAFGYNDIERMKERCEVRIREIQDELDEHNATTKIDIPDEVGEYR